MGKGSTNRIFGYKDFSFLESISSGWRTSNAGCLAGGQEGNGDDGCTIAVNRGIRFCVRRWSGEEEAGGRKEHTKKINHPNSEKSTRAGAFKRKRPQKLRSRGTSETAFCTEDPILRGGLLILLSPRKDTPKKRKREGQRKDQREEEVWRGLQKCGKLFKSFWGVSEGHGHKLSKTRRLPRGKKGKEGQQREWATRHFPSMLRRLIGYSPKQVFFGGGKKDTDVDSKEKKGGAGGGGGGKKV